MGLSIGAFLITGPGEEDCDYHFFNNPDFPGRADEIKTGWYTAQSLGPRTCWSYSGYSEFREWLARLVVPDTYHRVDLKIPHLLSMSPVEWADFHRKAYLARHPAFGRVADDPNARLHELINFSDCEGVIGHSVCKKLLGDLDGLDFIKRTDFDLFSHEEQFLSLKASIRSVVDAGPLAVLNFS